ncbi:MAG: hypothetical protein ACYTGC_07330, partial [Planctomycetota bacterium]
MTAMTRADDGAGQLGAAREVVVDQADGRHEINIKGVFDDQRRPVEGASVAVRTGPMESVKALPAGGSSYRVEVDRTTPVVTLEIEHPLARGVVKIPLADGPVTEVDLFIEGGRIVAKSPRPPDLDDPFAPLQLLLGASDCCYDNGTPGCDDPACEALICGMDSFCCDVFWDQICADQALMLCQTCASNDDCEDAIALPVPSMTAGTTMFATVDAGVPDCSVGITSPGVWYTVEGAGAPMTATLCPPRGGADFDSKLTVYSGSCADLTCVVDNDDTCGLQSEVSWCARTGTTYYILVHGFGGEFGGFTLDVREDGTQPCDNDECTDAVPLAVPSTTDGTTVFATLDMDAPFCGTAVTSPGVWYTVQGTGTTMTASMCPPMGGADYDTKLSVYCFGCDELRCVTGIDDLCGLQSEVSWCSAGATYFILVHGFGGQTGNFTLDLSEDGAPCVAGVLCLPVGACCLPDGSCADGLAEAECIGSGGAYEGDDTMCAGTFLSYDTGACDSAFSSIAGLGGVMPGPSGDDEGLEIPIGFSFNFFGNMYTEVGISSNGYLSFGGSLTDFSNDPIPSIVNPNNLIAPYWTDLNPSDGGQIWYGLFDGGSRLIVEWNSVAEFGTGGASTVTCQAALHQDGTIQFIYGDLVNSPAGGPGSVSIGVEDALGIEGVSIDDTQVGNNCLQFALVLDDPIACINPGACCFINGDCVMTEMQDDCEALGGDYQGDGTLCADVDCPILDCNDNGILDDEETACEFDPLAAMPADDPYDGGNWVCTDIFYEGDTYTATNDTEFFCGLIYGGEYDVWYCYRPAHDGTAVIKVCDFAFTTPDWQSVGVVVSAWGSEGANGLSLLACNFNSSVGTNCGAIFEVSGGETYYIRVAGQDDSRGEFELEVKGPRCLCNPIDLNENGLPDECDCLGDVNGDGVVNQSDWDQVAMAIGSTCYGCPEDINGDGLV